MKIWSLQKHETMTTGIKIMWKRGEIAKEQFLLFSTIFSVYLYFQESNYIFICEMWLFELLFFLRSANLICRDTDISKYFRESLGLRDNENRLYLPEVFGETRGSKQCRPRSNATERDLHCLSLIQKFSDTSGDSKMDWFKLGQIW